MNIKTPGAKLFLVLALGFLLGWMAHLSPITAPINPAVPATGQVAHLMIDFGDDVLEIERNIRYSEGATVFSLTKDFTDRQTMPFVFDPPGSWGVFIRQIGTRQNGDGDRYWQYWVNHDQIQLAADRYQIQPNDVVEWKFIKTQK